MNDKVASVVEYWTTVPKVLSLDPTWSNLFYFLSIPLKVNLKLKVKILVLCSTQAYPKLVIVTLSFTYPIFEGNTGAYICM